MKATVYQARALADVWSGGATLGPHYSTTLRQKPTPLHSQPWVASWPAAQRARRPTAAQPTARPCPPREIQEGYMERGRSAALTDMPRGAVLPTSPVLSREACQQRGDGGDVSRSPHSHCHPALDELVAHQTVPVGQLHTPGALTPHTGHPHGCPPE